MQKALLLVIVVFCLGSVSFSFKDAQGENVEFVCMRKHMASKTCHYNFKVDGARFRYVDIGCKIKKQADVIDKAKTGDIALARDWKIECGNSVTNTSAQSGN
jgi:hypothetical protein